MNEKIQDINVRIQQQVYKISDIMNMKLNSNDMGYDYYIINNQGVGDLYKFSFKFYIEATAIWERFGPPEIIEKEFI